MVGSRVSTALLLILFSGAVDRASAQAGENDASARKLVEVALNNIHRGFCGNRTPCMPATPQEFAEPPIAMNEAKLVIERGVISGMGEACGLDWQRENFLPMMAYWRRGQMKNERQMALIGILHGLAQGAPKQQSCPDTVRREIQSKLAFKP